jgi:hypothetical protein
MNLVQALGYLGFVGACICAVICWFIAAINMFRTVAYRKPGVPLFPHWWESPFNILFRPSQLTARGLEARRWCFYGVVGFLVCGGFVMIVGVSTGVAH